MHVFCPDCNAEYKVNERSSLTKTVKFVCLECGKSWVDKFEKLEQAKTLSSISEAPISDNVFESTNEDIGTMGLNTLALEEVQYSFGNHKNRSVSENSNIESNHIFKFETSEVNKEIEQEGPSKTFPKIRKKEEVPSDDQIEERDAKEIEIEKRLKESSELLKKAKQPDFEKKETVQKEKKPKNRKVLVPLSILIIVGFFSYNLTSLFLEDILKSVPFAPEILSDVNRFTEIFKDYVSIIIKRVMNFIANLV